MKLYDRKSCLLETILYGTSKDIGAMVMLYMPSIENGEGITNRSDSIEITHMILLFILTHLAYIANG